jgi:hypothetical protein
MTKISKKDYSLNVPALDSFKYRIPLSRITILNQNILEKTIQFTANAETGEIISEKPIQSNSLKIQRSGYHIHFGIIKLPTETALTVLINSKLLEHEYLNGINLNNSYLIYKNVMECKVFECSYEDFLTMGILSDIDIKKDVKCDEDIFRNSIKELDKFSKPNRKKGFGVNTFDQRNNLGVEWNSREKATASNPFMKIYYKPIESKVSDAKQIEKNEIPFFETYCNPEMIENRVRVEVTLKNSATAKKHNIDSLRLFDVLRIEPETLDKIINDILSKNVDERLPKPRKSKTELGGMDLFIYGHIDSLLQQNNCIDKIIENMISLYPDKQSKWRYKAKMLNIYSTQFDTKKYAKKQTKMTNFFKSIGWS